MDLNRVKEETEAALKALNELAAEGIHAGDAKSEERKVMQFISKDEASRSGLADFFEDEEDIPEPDRIDAAKEYLAAEIMHNGYEDDPEDEAAQMLPRDSTAIPSKNKYEKSKKMEAVMKMQSTFDKIRLKGRTVPWRRVFLAIACVLFCAGLITAGIIFIISHQEGVGEFFPGLDIRTSKTIAETPQSSTMPPEAVIDSPVDVPVDAPVPKKGGKHPHGGKDKDKHPRDKSGKDTGKHQGKGEKDRDKHREKVEGANGHYTYDEYVVTNIEHADSNTQFRRRLRRLDP